MTKWIGLIAAFVSAVILLSGCSTASKANDDTTDSLVGSRPNIIFILVDDQGYGELSCHGNPWLKTPHIDRLHSESVRLTDFQVSPSCAPSRTAIMTGRHEFKSGVTHTVAERERMSLEATTLPQVLKSAGYTTGIFGKWHLGEEDAYQPGNRGFDEVFIHGCGSIGARRPGSGSDVPGNKYFNPIFRHNGRFVRTTGFCTDVLFRQATGWIKQQQGKSEPFFAYLPLNAAHSPYIAPKRYTEKFLQQGMAKPLAGFYGMIENIDDNVGTLMDQLKAWGLEENTLVIFMTDNGSTVDYIVKHNPGMARFIHKAGMKGHKGTADEGGTRVPGFWRWKGKLPEGVDVDRLASNIDVLPTLAAFAGAELPSDGQVEGRNLVPLLQNAAAPWEDRYVFIHRGRWAPGSDPDQSKYVSSAIRNERFRFVNNSELYDVQVDLGQQVNVIDRHPKVVQQMRAAYEAWWDEVRPMMINESATYEGAPPYVKHYRQQKEQSGIPAWSPLPLR